MGVYIRGMDVPTSCARCLLVGWNYVFECRIDDVECGERLASCPLVPVPEHGRLIDADVLKARVQKLQEWLWDKLTDADVGIVTADDVRFRIAEESEDFIDNAPTIIPADPAKEGEE